MPDAFRQNFFFITGLQRACVNSWFCRRHITFNRSGRRILLCYCICAFVFRANIVYIYQIEWEMLRYNPFQLHVFVSFISRFKLYFHVLGHRFNRSTMLAGKRTGCNHAKSSERSLRIRPKAIDNFIYQKK